MVRFKFLIGDVNYTQYGGKFISNVQNNGEFDYYFVIELINWEEAVGEREAPSKYHVSLAAISPEQVGKDKLTSAFADYGLDDEMMSKPEIQVEVLHGAGYGVVPVWGENGNNWRKLMRDAHKQAQIASMLCGFVFDRVLNGIGETGWERLKHTDVSDVLKRVMEKNPTPEQQLMAKLEG